MTEKMPESKSLSYSLYRTARILRFAVPSLFSSMWEYAANGPVKQSWDFKQHASFRLVKTYLANTAERGNVAKEQRLTSTALPNVTYPDAEIRKVTFNVASQAIAFMKTAVTHWPEVADNENYIVDAEWLNHTESKADQVLLHFHGGAYSLGSAKMERFLTYPMTKMGKISTFSVNYRLAPPYAFPCGLIDAISSYMYLLVEGYDPKKIVLSGTSAGGGLAMATLLAIRDMNLPQPGGGLLFSPWVDLTLSFPSFESNAHSDYLPHPRDVSDPLLIEMAQSHFYAKDDELKNQFVSPVWAKSLDNLPRIMIQSGSAERLYDENIHLAERLHKAGNQIMIEVFEEQVHVFHLFQFLPISAVAVSRAASYLRKVMGTEEGSLDTGMIRISNKNIIGTKESLSPKL